LLLHVRHVRHVPQGRMTLPADYPLGDVVRDACAAIAGRVYAWDGGDGMPRSRRLTGGDVEVAQFIFGGFAELLINSVSSPRCLRAYTGKLTQVVARMTNLHEASISSSLSYLRRCLGSKGLEVQTGDAQVTLVCFRPGAHYTRFDLAVQRDGEIITDTRGTPESFAWSEVVRKYGAVDIPYILKRHQADCPPDESGSPDRSPSSELIVEDLSLLIKRLRMEEPNDPIAGKAAQLIEKATAEVYLLLRRNPRGDDNG